MMFRVPSVATASEIVPPSMIFSKAAISGKAGRPHLQPVRAAAAPSEIA